MQLISFNSVIDEACLSNMNLQITGRLLDALCAPIKPFSFSCQMWPHTSNTYIVHLHFTRWKTNECFIGFQTQLIVSTAISVALKIYTMKTKSVRETHGDNVVQGK